MANYAKDTCPKTTIRKDGPEGLTLVTTLPGLPYGAPKIGQVVHVPNYGQATCSGVTHSGSGVNQSVVEIKLIIK